MLLYARDFDRDYSFDGRELAGEAHPWGTLIISVPTLLDSFDDPDDGYHVGLHEFAHLADMWGTHFDGIPSGFDEAKSRRWLALAAHRDGADAHRALGDRPLRRGERGGVPGRGGGGLLRAAARCSAAATPRCTRCWPTTSARTPRPGTTPAES